LSALFLSKAAGSGEARRSSREQAKQTYARERAEAFTSLDFEVKEMIQGKGEAFGC